MNIQEREELDFNWGRQTDLQNMFEQERIETVIPKETQRVKELTRAGFYVAVSCYEVFGRWTDAFIGCTYEVFAVARSFDEALDAIGGEESAELHIEFPEAL